MTTERNLHRQDRIMDEVEWLVSIWRTLGPERRRMVNEHVGRDLYRALHALAIEVEGCVPLPEEPDEDDGTVNGALGVTGFAPPVEVEDDGADPDPWNTQLTRREALQQARKAWGGTMSDDAERHAIQIITIAQEFERYLTGGTGRTPAEEQVEADRLVSRQEYLSDTADSLAYIADLHATDVGRHAVLNAAGTWVERAHLRNPSGLNNWRNWADDHDVLLINAVLRYRGMPPIESEKP